MENKNKTKKIIQSVKNRESRIENGKSKMETLITLCIENSIKFLTIRVSVRMEY